MAWSTRPFARLPLRGAVGGQDGERVIMPGVDAPPEALAAVRRRRDAAGNADATDIEQIHERFTRRQNQPSQAELHESLVARYRRVRRRRSSLDRAAARATRLPIASVAPSFTSPALLQARPWAARPLPQTSLPPIAPQVTVPTDQDPQDDFCAICMCLNFDPVFDFPTAPTPRVFASSASFAQLTRRATK